MGAGMRTALMERPGNAPLSDEDRVRVPLQLKTLDNLDTLLKLAPAW
jgi:methionine salvage enolase-phosphatase E1